MPRLDIDPRRDGFHFINSFVDRILPGVTNMQTSGRCGGMCMAVLDYWRSGVAVPTHRTVDLGSAGVPADGTLLSTYIYDRQVNSLLTKASFTRWIVPFPTDENFFWWATNSEFEVVAGVIDQGRPCLLGLIHIDRDPMQGHQVLCYGYERNPLLLWIYDPNRPDEEIRLEPVSIQEGVALIGENGVRYEHYRGYFWQDVYNWDEPPYQPPYFDLGVKDGITISPSADDVLVGGKLECSVTVRNYSEYPAPLRQLYIYVRGPAGENLDGLLGGGDGNPTPIQPGEDRSIHRTSDHFGNRPGRYIVGVSYLSNQDRWRPIKAAEPSAVNVRQVTVRAATQQLIRDEWFDVRESDFDVNTNIVFRSGDEFACEAVGRIWAGVWFTGENGPEGWTGRLETNPRSPLHEGPQSYPFSLLGRFEGGPYFYIGTGLNRRPYTGPLERRLFLRINDDTPANGNGAFRCRVRQWRA